MNELRSAESIAGRQYWQSFAHVPIHFDHRWRSEVPEHWHRAGPRTSPVDPKRPRQAGTPAHAILNYLYAIAQTEATIAAQRMGFDPTLGLMHTDKRYRPSLASDLMEPVRPVADRIAFELLRDREFSRGEVVETRQGVCRLGSGLARELGQYSPPLREAVGPHAERLARELLEGPGSSDTAYAEETTPCQQGRMIALTRRLAVIFDAVGPQRQVRDPHADRRGNPLHGAPRGVTSPALYVRARMAPYPHQAPRLPDSTPARCELPVSPDRARAEAAGLFVFEARPATLAATGHIDHVFGLNYGRAHGQPHAWIPAPEVATPLAGGRLGSTLSRRSSAGLAR